MWRICLRIQNGKSLDFVLVNYPNMSFPSFAFNQSVNPLSVHRPSSQGKQGKGKTITLKMALNCITLTFDEKRCLDLSLKELSTVPKCVEKMCHVEELNLSRNLLKKIPDFINQFTAMRMLDLHSNYVSMIRNFLYPKGELFWTITQHNSYVHIGPCMKRKAQ